ncbi:hypothetical protein DL764_010193 [Monosporascus ibericus]|uniref:Uncharacterized protein n=1 Tax=Monosporascus ibericus TaxID=155417 RepID=A0A4Q4ST56_9PEZI|nr:hypothetical protein DL764_010193 [Monosporascus ibericus]
MRNEPPDIFGRVPYDGDIWNRAQPSTGNKRWRPGSHAATWAKRFRGKNGKVPNNQESPGNENGKGAGQSDDDAFSSFAKKNPEKFEAVDDMNAAAPPEVANADVGEKLYKHT